MKTKNWSLKEGDRLNQGINRNKLYIPLWTKVKQNKKKKKESDNYKKEKAERWVNQYQQTINV